MMKPNPILKIVTCDIPNPSQRCSLLIKYSSKINIVFDTSVSISLKESTRINRLYVTQFIKQTKVKNQ